MLKGNFACTLYFLKEDYKWSFCPNCTTFAILKYLDYYDLFVQIRFRMHFIFYVIRYLNHLILVYKKAFQVNHSVHKLKICLRPLN